MGMDAMIETEAYGQLGVKVVNPNLVEVYTLDATPYKLCTCAFEQSGWRFTGTPCVEVEDEVLKLKTDKDGATQQEVISEPQAPIPLVNLKPEILLRLNELGIKSAHREPIFDVHLVPPSLAARRVTRVVFTSEYAHETIEAGVMPNGRLAILRVMGAPGAPKPSDIVDLHGQPIIKLTPKKGRAPDGNRSEPLDPSAAPVPPKVVL